MKSLKKVILQYDIEDDLQLSFGHKLRGFFANQFEEVLFHHHLADGSLKYQYPLIQYKILDHRPTVIGLGEGALLVIEKFMEVDHLKLGPKTYDHPEGQLIVENEELTIENEISMPRYKYTFLSPWVGLNQNNFTRYIQQIQNNSKEKRISFLEKILVGNILSFAKAIGWWVEEELIAIPKVKEVPIKFKNQEMIGFKGVFYSNAKLPEFIGLGKSSSRGFGIIKREELI